MKFTDQQLAAIQSRHKNVVVCASAGSGKTSVLVERLCQLVIRDRIPINHILAMTFTNDAAAEMKSSLRQRLLEQAQDEFILSQLALLETAQICTIDSFCLNIVQNYYYKIPISYTMAQTIASDLQKTQAFNQAYQKACVKMEPEAFRILNHYFAAFSKNEQDIQKNIEQCINIAWSKPDPKQWLKTVIQPDSPAIEQWMLRYFQNQIQAIIDELAPIEDWHETLAQKKEGYQQILEQCTTYEDLYNMLPQHIRITAKFPTVKQLSVDISSDDLKPYRESIQKRECGLMEVLFSKEQFIKDRKIMQPVYEAFYTLCIYTKDFFDQQKREMEIIDFNDMEHFAYLLLQQDVIRQEVQDQYETILIDEFQDTNDLQESIIKEFCRQDNVFRVGDIKQSIYGFRMARPDIMRGHMVSKDPHDQTLVLDQNFRSNANIIEFNNEFYEKIMNTDLLGNHFDTIDIAHVGSPAQSEASQVPIRFVYTQYKDWAKENGIHTMTAMSKHKKNRMDLIAQDILKKHTEQKVPYRDICILSRNHSPQLELQKVLEAYGIPSVSDNEHGFYRNQAVQIVLSTLQALIDPSDDINLCAALCSAIGQVKAEQLALSCLGKDHHIPLYYRIENEAYMTDWHALRQYRYEPLPNLIRAIYAHNDYYENHTTTQDKANLDFLLEKASLYPDVMDTLGFARQMQEEAERDSQAEAYPYGKNADIVQLKTIHRSKGLQFPIVYLLSSEEFRAHGSNGPILLDADLGISFKTLVHHGKVKRISQSHLAIQTKQFIDTMNEEMRILYVATTRPQKELIIVDAIEDKNLYLSPLNTSAILNKKGYTGWFFHTYFGSSASPIRFEESHGLCERPQPPLPKIVSFDKEVYGKETPIWESATASGTKIKMHWTPFEILNEKGTERGTLFHEIMGQCPYPYQKEDCIAFAKASGYTLTSYDLKQLLQLNEQKIYAQWLQQPHAFECAYITEKDHVITHGSMDLVIWMPDKTIVLDFKTDHADEHQLLALYTEQLQTYRDSILAIDPTKPVEAVIYSFYLNKFFQVV